VQEYTNTTSPSTDNTTSPDPTPANTTATFTIASPTANDTFVAGVSNVTFSWSTNDTTVANTTQAQVYWAQLSQAFNDTPTNWTEAALNWTTGDPWPTLIPESRSVDWPLPNTTPAG
jgi:hypothetical protein